MPHFMIVLIPCINLLNLSWTIKCLFSRDMEPLKIKQFSNSNFIKNVMHLTSKTKPLMKYAKLLNYQFLLHVHGQVNDQNPLVQPRFTCPKIDIFLISRRKHMFGYY